MTQALPKSEIKNGQVTTSLLSIYEPICEPLASVNGLLNSQIQSGGSVLAERLEQSGLSSGKRIRPAMLLLSGACFGDLKKTHIAAAAAVELVHAATLVHDDVLDNADQRRHETSMNSRWNNTTSILTGDYLFSKAFDVCCSSGSMEAIRRVANASCKVCEGEINQNATSGDFQLSEDQYLEMISLKTAELCKCACGLGSLLSECDLATVAAFERYGQDLGVAFQIIDDVLDIVGQQDRVGKTLGTDLLNKKLTLPMIHCLSHIDSTTKTEILDRLNNGLLSLEDVVPYLLATGSIEYARQSARSRAGAAFKFASSLADSPCAYSLRMLAEFVIERTF